MSLEEGELPRDLGEGGSGLGGQGTPGGQALPPPPPIPNTPAGGAGGENPNPENPVNPVNPAGGAGGAPGGGVDIAPAGGAGGDVIILGFNVTQARAAGMNDQEIALVLAQRGGAGAPAPLPPVGGGGMAAAADRARLDLAKGVKFPTLEEEPSAADLEIYWQNIQVFRDFRDEIGHPPSDRDMLRLALANSTGVAHRDIQAVYREATSTWVDLVTALEASFGDKNPGDTKRRALERQYWKEGTLGTHIILWKDKLAQAREYEPIGDQMAIRFF